MTTEEKQEKIIKCAIVGGWTKVGLFPRGSKLSNVLIGTDSFGFINYIPDYFVDYDGLNEIILNLSHQKREYFLIRLGLIVPLENISHEAALCCASMEHRIEALLNSHKELFI